MADSVAHIYGLTASQLKLTDFDQHGRDAVHIFDGEGNAFVIEVSVFIDHEGVRQSAVDQVEAIGHALIDLATVARRQRFERHDAAAIHPDQHSKWEDVKAEGRITQERIDEAKADLEREKLLREAEEGPTDEPF